MTNTNRTDCHRVSAIVPADYVQVLDYSLAGMDEPAWRVDCAMTGRAHGKGPCCWAKLRADEVVRWAEHGGLGKCGVCGANFRHGTVLRHEPTGEHLHIGHDCARKWEVSLDLSAFELERKRRDRARMVEVTRTRKAAERAAFLSRHEGLEADLETDHQIVRDIKAKFVQWCDLSDKQVALVRKIAAETRNPPQARIEIPKIPAPTGRVSFCGKVVSQRVYDGAWGLTCKILVVVSEAGGEWLAWISKPADLAGEPVRGEYLHFVATLETGNEPHFARGSRASLVRPWVAPRKARKIAPTPPDSSR